MSHLSAASDRLIAQAEQLSEVCSCQDSAAANRERGHHPGPTNEITPAQPRTVWSIPDDQETNQGIPDEQGTNHRAPDQQGTNQGAPCPTSTNSESSILSRAEQAGIFSGVPLSSESFSSRISATSYETTEATREAKWDESLVEASREWNLDEADVPFVTPKEEDIFKTSLGEGTGKDESWMVLGDETKRRESSSDQPTRQNGTGKDESWTVLRDETKRRKSSSDRPTRHQMPSQREQTVVSDKNVIIICVLCSLLNM